MKSSYVHCAVSAFDIINGNLDQERWDRTEQPTIVIPRETSVKLISSQFPKNMRFLTIKLDMHADTIDLEIESDTFRGLKIKGGWANHLKLSGNLPDLRYVSCDDDSIIKTYELSPTTTPETLSIDSEHICWKSLGTADTTRIDSLFLLGRCNENRLGDYEWPKLETLVLDTILSLDDETFKLSMPSLVSLTLKGRNIKFDPTFDFEGDLEVVAVGSIEIDENTNLSSIVGLDLRTPHLKFIQPKGMQYLTRVELDCCGVAKFNQEQPLLEDFELIGSYKEMVMPVEMPKLRYIRNKAIGLNNPLPTLNLTRGSNLERISWNSMMGMDLDFKANPNIKDININGCPHLTLTNLDTASKLDEFKVSSSSELVQELTFAESLPPLTQVVLNLSSLKQLILPLEAHNLMELALECKGLVNYILPANTPKLEYIKLPKHLTPLTSDG